MEIKNSLNSLKGYSYLLIINFFLGGNFIAGEMGHPLLPPWQFAFWRFLIAFLILFPFVFRRILTEYRLLIRYWRPLFLLGLIGIVPSAFTYISLNTTDSINASFIGSSTPILTMLFAWVFLKDRITFKQLIGVIITFLGLLAIVFEGSLQNILNLDFCSGDLWMFAHALCFALYTICIQRWKLPINDLLLIASIIFSGAVLLFPFSFIEGFYFRHSVLSWNSVFAIGYTGIFAGALAVFGHVKAITLVGSNKANLFLYSIPVFTTIQAYVLLGERLFLYDIISAVMIVIGIILILFFDPKLKETVQTKAEAQIQTNIQKERES